MRDHDVHFVGMAAARRAEEAWSVDHPEPAVAQANHETLRGIAAILQRFPALTCRVHGETGMARSAPAKLATFLGLHPVADVHACMDALAKYRASACLEALVEHGVPRAQLTVSSLGMGGRVRVDFIPEESSPSSAVAPPAPFVRTFTNSRGFVSQYDLLGAHGGAAAVEREVSPAKDQLVERDDEYPARLTPLDTGRSQASSGVGALTGELEAAYDAAYGSVKSTARGSAQAEAAAAGGGGGAAAREGAGGQPVGEVRATAGLVSNLQRLTRLANATRLLRSELDLQLQPGEHRRSSAAVAFSQKGAAVDGRGFSGAQERECMRALAAHRASGLAASREEFAELHEHAATMLELEEPKSIRVAVRALEGCTRRAQPQVHSQCAVSGAHRAPLRSLQLRECCR